MIVIEGPDGAGKTTLKENLLTHHDLHLVRRHCDSDGPIVRLRSWVERDLKQIPQAADLYDRHALISEPIYGPIVRGSTVEGFSDPEWFLSTWGSFLAQKPILIFCMPPLRTVMDNIHDPYISQMDGVERHIRAIYYSYHFLILRLKAGGYDRIITWDYTSPDIDRNMFLLSSIISQELMDERTDLD